MSAAVDSGHRRERFGHRRAGSGRQTTNRGFELVGRRSGVTLPTAVSKGDDGFDELSDYFDGDTSTITSATTTPMSKRSAQSSPDKSTFGNSVGERTGDSFRSAPGGEKRVSFGEATSSGTPEKATSRGQAATPPSSRRSRPGSKRASQEQHSAPQVTDRGEDDVSSAIAFDDYDEPPDEGPRDSDAESDEANRTPPQRSMPTASVQSVKKSPKKKGKSDNAPSKKASATSSKASKTATKPKKQAQPSIGGASSRRDHVQEETSANDSMEDDEDEPLQRTPGGTDPKKIRKSLGVGVHSSEELKRAQEEEERHGIRRSKRRRWNPLKYWQSERLRYKREDPDDGFGEQLPVAERAEMLGIGSPDQEYKRSARKAQTKKQKKRRKKDPQPVSPDPKHKPLPSSSLPKNVTFTEEAQFNVSDGASEYIARAWGRYNSLNFSALGESGKCFAGLSLDNPQFVSGIMRLDPKGSKGREVSTGKSQIFFVYQCQPKSIQFSVEDKHTLLTEGDSFFVPYETGFNIVNHSKEVTAEFFFVLLRDPSDMEEENEKGEESMDEDEEEEESDE